MAITALDLSYGTALLPAPFKRWVGKAGAVNLNPAGTPVFLWTRSDEDGLHAISDVVILHDEEPTPPGYKRVARDLSAGTPGRSAYLAFAADTQLRRLVSLQVLAEGDEPELPQDVTGAALQLVDRALTREGPILRLALVYAPLESAHQGSHDEQDPAAWAASLSVGDAVDACDALKRWRAGHVVAVSDCGTTVTVAFDGWSEKHNLQIPRSATDLLAPPGRRRVLAKQPSSRTVAKRGAADLLALDDAALSCLEAKIADWVCGTFPSDPRERELFTRHELPTAVYEVLSSKHATDEAQERSVRFLHRSTEVVVWHLRRLDAPVPREVSLTMARILLAEHDESRLFYNEYGSCKPENPLTLQADGWAARIPSGGASRFFVMAVNNFHASGGYDALLARLQHMVALGRQQLEQQQQQPVSPTPSSTGGTASSVASPRPGAIVPAHDPSPSSSSSLALLDTPNGEDPAAELLSYAAALLVPRVCYTPEWVLAYYQPLRDAILGRLATMSLGQLKRVSRDVLETVRDKLAQLGKFFAERHPAHGADILAGPSRACAGDTNALAAIERWQLAMAARLLKTDSLALRVKAVSDVRDVVEAVVDAEESAARFSTFGGSTYNATTGTGGTVSNSYKVGNTTTYTSSSWAPPARTWQSAGELMRFLTSNRIVELVLGDIGDGVGGSAVAGRAGAGRDLVHAQTVSRLGPILKFLATHTVPSSTATQPGDAGDSLPSEDGGDPSSDSPSALTPPPPLIDELAIGLRESHLTSLLSLAGDGDDDMTRVIYELVSALVHSLPLHLLSRCCDALGRVPPASLDKPTIALLRDVTAAGLTATAQAREAARAVARAREVAVGRRKAQDMNAIDEDDEKEDDDDVFEKAEDGTSAGSVSTGFPADPGSAIVASSARSSALDASLTQSDEEFRSDPSNWFLLRTLLSVALDSCGAAAAPAPSGLSGVPVSSPRPAQAGAAAEVASAASDAVVELLRGRERHAVEIVKECCVRLREGRGVPQVVQLVYALLRALGRHPPDPAAHAVSAFLGSPEFDGVRVMVDEIVRYKAVAAAAAAAAGIAVPSPAGAALRIDGRSHLEHVTLRLDFLAMVLRAAHSPPSFTDLSALWVSIADGRLCEEEAEAFFKWFSALKAPRQEAPQGLLSDRRTLFALFDGFLCDPTHFPPERAGPDAWALFEWAFAHVNNRRRALGTFPQAGDYVKMRGLSVTQAPSASPRPAIRARMALAGIEQLWAMAERAENGAIAKSAASRLVDLHAWALSSTLDDTADSDTDEESASSPVGASAAAPPGPDEADDLYGPPAPSPEPTPVAAPATAGAPSEAAYGADDSDDDSDDEGGAGDPDGGAWAASLPQVLRLKRAVWESFVRLAIARMRRQLGAIAAARDAKAPSARATVVASTRAIGRMMSMLRSFLASLELNHQSPEQELASRPTRQPQGDGLVLGIEGIWQPRLSEVKPEVVTVFVRSFGAPDPATGQPRVTLQRVYLHVRSELETIGDMRDRLAEGLRVPYVRLFREPPSKQQGVDGQPGRQAIGRAVDGITFSRTRLSLQLWGDVARVDEEDAAAHRPSTILQRLRGQYARLAALAETDAASLLRVFDRELDKLALYHRVVRAPRALLSAKPSYFELLFELLSSPSSGVVSAAWGLLQSLPTNARVQRDIATLRGRVPAEEGADGSALPPPSPQPFDWRTVLDGSSPLKLLYSLEILDKRLSGAVEVDESAADAAAAPAASTTAGADAAPSEQAAPSLRDAVAYASSSSPYVRAFVESGGLARLLELLHSLPLDEVLGHKAAGQALYRRCAAVLLRLVSLFLRSPQGLRELPGITIDRPALVRRLLDVVVTVTTAELPRSADSAASGGALMTPPLSSNAGDSSETASSPALLNLERAALDTPSTASAAASPSAAVAADGSDDIALPAVFGTISDDDFEPESDSASNSSADSGSEGGGGGGSLNGQAPELAALQAALGLLRYALLAPTVREGGHAHVGTSTIWGLQGDAFAAFASCPGIDALIAASILAPSEGRLRDAVVGALVAISTAADEGTAVQAGTTAPPQQLGVSPFTSLLVRSLWSTHFAIYLPPGCGSPEALKAFVGLLVDLHIPTTDQTATGASSQAAALAAAQARAVQLLPDPQTLIRSLCASIARHPIVEAGAEEEDPRDQVLIALLSLTSMVLRLVPSLCALAGAPVDRGGLGLLDDVFHACLFAAPSDGEPGPPAGESFGAPPKCKSFIAREAAFNVLQALAEGSPDNTARLAVKLLPHHDPAHDAAAHSSGGAAALLAPLPDDPLGPVIKSIGRYAGFGSTTGATVEIGGRVSMVPPRRQYVGIANPGCVCYMNATIQQFFLNAAFRRGVLSWQEPASSPGDRADSLLCQLQRQFAFLQESAKQYFSPRGLCHAIKDWEGNPTDVMEQKDVPEFLTKLFADMESQAQGTPLATLVRDVYGGVAIQELIADDPRAGVAGGGSDSAAPPSRLYSGRNDEFSFLQLQVRGNGSLGEALREYVAGERVDYKWTLPALPGETQGDAGGGGGGGGGAPGKKAEEVTLKTVKRVSLRSVGPHLMLHLSRFAFDYDTMQNVKLNDRFEFPRSLDLWPYSLWGRAEEEGEPAPASGPPPDRSEFLYELVGVVIHMGSALGGHYFSYIRERSPSEGPSESDRWFEFNDALVAPWEATDEAFERDCYGGVETVATGVRFTNSRPGGGAAGGTYERVRSANAFCLFYDRVRKPAAAPGAPSAASSAMDVTAVPTSSAAASSTAPPAQMSVVPSSEPGAPHISVQLPADPIPAFVTAQALGTAGGGAARSERIRASLRAPVPADVLAEIHGDNSEFRRSRTVHGDPAYFDFLRRLIRACAPADGAGDASASLVTATGSGAYPWAGVNCQADAMAASGPPGLVAHLACAILTRTLPASPAQRTKWPGWLDDCAALLRTTPLACAALLQSALLQRESLVRQLVGEATGGTMALSMTTDVARDVLSELVTVAVATLWPLEASPQPPSSLPRAPLAPELPAEARELQWDRTPWRAAPGQIVAGVIEALVTALPRLTPPQVRKAGGLFAILAAFAATDAAAVGTLLSRGALGSLVAFLLAGDGVPYGQQLMQPPPPPAAAAPAAAAGSSSTSSFAAVPSSASSPSYPSMIFASSSSSSSSSAGAKAGVHGGKGAKGAARATAAQQLAMEDWRVPDVLNTPEFAPLMQLLLRLVLASAPPSGRPGSPAGEPPQTRLSDVDSDVVTSAAFLRSVCTHLTSGFISRTRFAPLVTHLLWGATARPSSTPQPAVASVLDDTEAGEEPEEPPSYGAEALVATCARVIANAVADAEYDEMHLPFRLAALVCGVTGDDSEGVPPGTAQAGRVDAVMRALLQAMKANARFYRATETACEWLTKLAKNGAVAAWLGSHTELWRWCDAWLRAHPVPPDAKPAFSKYNAAKGGWGSVNPFGAAPAAADDGSAVVLMKRAGGTYGGYGSSGLYGAAPVRPRALQRNMRRLLRGTRPQHEAYESDDDPGSVIGRNVLVYDSSRDTRGTGGQITGYSAATGKHVLVIDTVPNPVSLDLTDGRKFVVRLRPDAEEVEGGEDDEAAGGSDDAGASATEPTALEDDVGVPSYAATIPVAQYYGAASSAAYPRPTAVDMGVLAAHAAADADAADFNGALSASDRLGSLPSSGPSSLGTVSDIADSP